MTWNFTTNAISGIPTHSTLNRQQTFSIYNIIKNKLRNPIKTAKPLDTTR